MTHQHKIMYTTMLLAATLTACSQTKSFTKLGSQNEAIKEDTSLLVPPSLKMPGATNNSTTASTQHTRPAVSTRTAATTTATRAPIKRRPAVRKAIARPGGNNYYVVVGTYPSQQEAMDTFIRLSSIGLPNSTMETRTTRSGKRLHMVRLGPFQDQAKIDKVKDSLISDGLSQFKVVKD